MSNKKTNKKSRKHGGKRAGAGHPRSGITKVKKCVSVTKTVWQDALKMWDGNSKTCKGSQLVDGLLARFVARKATI
jgi:hypothetical protein